MDSRKKWFAIYSVSKSQRRNSQDYKIFPYNLYLYSPSAYKLARTLIPLPNHKVLANKI